MAWIMGPEGNVPIQEFPATQLRVPFALTARLLSQGIWRERSKEGGKKKSMLVPGEYQYIKWESGEQSISVLGAPEPSSTRVVWTSEM